MSDKDLIRKENAKVIEQGGKVHLAMREGEVIVVKRYPSVKERPDLYRAREDAIMDQSSKTRQQVVL